MIPVLFLFLGFFAGLTPKTIVNESLSVPEVYISQTSVEQGEVLFIKIKNSSNIKSVTGKIGLKKIIFFKPQEDKDWIGFSGIDASKPPGAYKLVINFDKSEFDKEITVVERKVLLTKLEITRTLREKGFTQEKIISDIGGDNAVLNKILLALDPENYIKKAFVYPLSKIKVVGEFGNIREGQYGSARHLGVDLQAPTGAEVYAANSGIVRFAENLETSGNTIIIDHGSGIFSLYLHLSEIGGKVGEFVEHGQTIGLSGNTGYSIAPHLHFSIKINGSSVDPLKFVELTQTEM